MPAIRSFRELRIYECARKQSKRIFAISKSFPKEEKYSLTDQIRRSSRAVNAMVAEAWARRRYQAAFENKINEALGEAMETQVWIDHAYDCDYISIVQHQELDDAWQMIGAMLNKMIERSYDFCKSAHK